MFYLQFLCGLNTNHLTAVTDRVQHPFTACLLSPSAFRDLHNRTTTIKTVYTRVFCPDDVSGFKETAFLLAVSSAALTHALAKACSSGRMERCTCDDSPGIQHREAWQWGVCGDNLKYSTKFLKKFLGQKRVSKDLRAQVDAHNVNVGIRVSLHPTHQLQLRLRHQKTPDYNPQLHIVHGASQTNTPLICCSRWPRWITQSV